MKRRNFLQHAAIASSLPLAVPMDRPTEQAATNEWYEWRTYELKFGGNRNALFEYMDVALKPALLRNGANHVMAFQEIGMSDPTRIHLLISYPSPDIFVACANLSSDTAFKNASIAYDALPPEEAPYTRISSSLLHAFDGLPRLLSPPEAAQVFELRIYEGYSENAVKRKIGMFNKEEIDLFYTTGLNPVFFSNMVVGPFCPSLVYMLHFNTMEDRDAHWRTFINHPEWKKMAAKPEYANSVSNIRRTFLKPLT